MSEGAPPYDYTEVPDSDIIGNHPAPAGLEGAEAVAAYRTRIPVLFRGGADEDDGE